MPAGCESDASWLPISIGSTVSGALTLSDCRVLRTPSLRFSDQFTYESRRGLTRFTATDARPKRFGPREPPVQVDLHPLNDLGWDGDPGRRDSISVRTLTAGGMQRLRVEETYGRLISYRLTSSADSGTADCTVVLATLGTSETLLLPRPPLCYTNKNDPYQGFRFALAAGVGARLRVVGLGFPLKVRIVDLNGSDSLQAPIVALTALEGDSVDIVYPSSGNRKFALEVRPRFPSTWGRYRVDFR